MSDTPTAAPPATTAATGAPVTTPAASPTPAPPPTSDGLPAVGEQGWLKARLDRATEDGEKRARKELKAEKKAARAAADEAKAVAANAQAEVAAALRAADAILGEVPEAERKAIVDAAGGNAAKRLELFAAWKIAKGSMQPAAAPQAPVPAAAPTPAVTAPAAVTPAQPAPLPAPATSAPAAAAPPPPTPGATENKREVYETLRQSNPYLAAQYLLNNQSEIYADRTFEQVRQARKT